jgi:hypothetical protein
MEKHRTHNTYLAELETVLAGVKAQLIEAEHAYHIVYKSAHITEKAAEHDKKVKKQDYVKTTGYLKDLTEMSNTAYDLQLLSDKVIAMSTIASTDEKSAVDKIKVSARSIESAMEAVVALHSLAASINAKTTTEDSKSVVSRAADELNSKWCFDAAIAAEIATMSSLHASIFATESSAKFIVGNITDFQTSITALTTNITKTKSDALTNNQNSFAAYQTALKTASDSEKTLESAHLNWKSAEMANDEDNIKLGLREAQKQVIEDERKAAAAAAASNTKK